MADAALCLPLSASLGAYLAGWLARHHTVISKSYFLVTAQHRVLNISKSEHITNSNLYDGIPRVSQRIAARRMRLAGHSHRHPELPASHLVMGEPTHGHRSRGRPTQTYVDVLRNAKHKRAGRMYGEPGWLEETMEGSSDDLERKRDFHCFIYSIIDFRNAWNGKKWKIFWSRTYYN